MTDEQQQWQGQPSQNQQQQQYPRQQYPQQRQQYPQQQQYPRQQYPQQRQVYPQQQQRQQYPQQQQQYPQQQQVVPPPAKHHVFAIAILLLFLVIGTVTVFFSLQKEVVDEVNDIDLPDQEEILPVVQQPKTVVDQSSVLKLPIVKMCNTLGDDGGCDENKLNKFSVGAPSQIYMQLSGFEQKRTRYGYYVNFFVDIETKDSNGAVVSDFTGRAITVSDYLARKEEYLNLNIDLLTTGHNKGSYTYEIII